jgi:hypothetical protein
MAAIYQADVWCDDCAGKIHGWGDFRDHCGDSDDGPVYMSDDEESDSPQHCASGETCLNAVKLPSGRKIGLLFGSLTSDGYEYVREAALDGGEVANLWVRHFETDGGYDFELIECPHCGGFVDSA